MNRLKFLETLLVLPVGIFLVHCSSDNSSSNTATGGTGNTDPDAPGADPSKSGTSTVYTSSVTGGHHHTFSIDDADVATPPAAGLNGSTSTDAGHSHSVTISQDQLAQVGMGQSVKVTTNASSHTHVFTFLKIG